MGKKQNGGPMLFVKNGGKLSAPSDRPGGPLISYYAKKGGKIPQANFTNYSGTQMYGTGGNFDYNLPSMKYSQTPSGQAYKNGGTIHINPANKGKFNATKARTGKSTEELTHSSNPVTKKRAVFAQNAAKWKHANGGPILEESPYITDKGINLNLPVNRQQEVKPLKFNGFLANDRKENLIVGGINPRYQTKDFSVGPYVVGVGNKHFQKFPADMGMSGTYHVNDRLDIDMQGNLKNVNAGLRYKFYNGGPLLVGNQHVAMGGSLKQMYDEGGALNVAYRNGGKINPYALNIVGKGLKKYLLGGPTDETDGVTLSNQTPFSSWSRDKVEMDALNPKAGTYKMPNAKPTLQNEYVKPTDINAPEAPDEFKNKELAAKSYSSAIQAGTAFIGNFAETNRRKQEGAHDTGSMDDIKGAAKGMGTGASIGSTFGPIGTAVGAAVGGVAGYIGGRASGKVKKKAYDAWQADYMKAEQSAINSNAASRYQDFKPTSSGYYANGGKMYGPGGSMSRGGLQVQPTRQDSLDLYNNSNELLQYYRGKDYKNMGTSIAPDSQWIDFQNKLARESANKMVDDKVYPTTNRTGTLLNASMDFLKSLKSEKDDHLAGGDSRFSKDEYYQRIDANKYKQRERANWILDLRAPMGLYDSRITPTFERHYNNVGKSNSFLAGDGVSFYSYDPQLVKPADMKTAQDYKDLALRYPNKFKATPNTATAPKPNSQPVELQRPTTVASDKRSGPEYWDDGKGHIYQDKYKMAKDYMERPTPKKTSPRMSSLQPQQMQSSPVSMQGQPMQIQPMTLPQQKGKPVYGPGNTIIGYNGEDGMMKKAYQYTGAPNNKLNLQDKALLEDKDKWQQYLSSRDSGYKFATGGSMASNYMANQKAVGGNLVPLSSDAVEVKGPSHANGGVKLPEMEAEVEGKEVIKDDYVFSEQLGFAKEAKKLAKAKGRIEEKPSTPERINSLKLLESKENQLKLAQEFIRKQNNLQ